MTTDDDGYQVTITAQTRAGRRRTLYSVDLVDPGAVELTGRWRVWRGWHRERAARRRSSPAAATGESSAALGALTQPDDRSSPLEFPEGITEGLILYRDMLFHVCEALHRSRHREIDVDDLKRVVSIHGARLAQIDSLDEPTRRHATQALYSQIIRTLS